jgi:TonB-dependent SusC/RagA subfamily outer membrane receptor
MNKMNLSKILLLSVALCFYQLSAGQKVEKGSDKLIKITGKVMNENNDPVAGAVLYIDNLKTNNITDKNGSYKIKVSPSAINLEVRSSQYENSEIAINSQTTINFTLKESYDKTSLPLEKTKGKPAGKSDSTSARSKGKIMNTYNDIYQMIRAEVPGVIVSGRSIQIRQGHSFMGSSSPLFVVNGVIVPNFDNINPIEVKSITVLKGSEASIYGLNGSNGVIKITLKNSSEK